MLNKKEELQVKTSLEVKELRVGAFPTLSSTKSVF